LSTSVLTFIDQLLNYVLEFEENIIRLGGRTQDRDKIKKRTLYEITKASPIQIANSSFPRTKRSLENIKVQMREILDAFKTDFILPRHFVKRGLITHEQFESFRQGNQDWVSAEEDASPEGDISGWLGRENIEPREQSFDKYLDYEEEDLEMERIQELEAEFLGLGEDEDFDDTLRGQYEGLSHKQDARESMGVSQREIQNALNQDDVWAWPPHIRLAVYNHLRAKYIAMVTEEFRECNEKYADYAKDLAVAKREKQAYILESAKLIGMTTTGLAKYRTLVAAARPRVVMIEEAAESLEGPLIVGCTPSVQQLILVGDHRQLTGTCAVKDLERDPYFLCVSMFERLVNNDIGYTMLSAQRRKL
jgi:helicase required for RNAi-mediated heterochromatin assembly 1